MYNNSSFVSNTQERSLTFFPSWTTNSTWQPINTRESDDTCGKSSGLVVDAVVASSLTKTKTINWLRNGVRLHPLKRNNCSGSNLKVLMTQSLAYHHHHHHHHNSIYSARFTRLANGALQLFVWSGNACKNREK